MYTIPLGMFFFSFLRKTFFLPAAAAFAISQKICRRLLLARSFLLSDGRAPRALTGARVGMRPLSPHRQSTAGPQTAIRADVHQALDVHLNSLPQIALDLSLSLEHRANPA